MKITASIHVSAILHFK